MIGLLKRIGWAPNSVLDVGGFKGNWTREIQQAYPAATYTVIEPNPHPELRTLNARVLYEVLADTAKSVNWYSTLGTGDSLYKELTPQYASVSPTSRTTTTLDALFPTESFDFVKLDCQGAELDVLRGGSRVLGEAEVLLMECSFAGRYNLNAPTFAEYIQTADSLGFAPLDIVEHHRIAGLLFQVDLVFLRKSSPLWSQIQATLIR
jgi:FkbM family methyltransferase